MASSVAQFKGEAVGIWIETGVFLLVLAFGIWQIQDVKKERRKRSLAREALEPQEAQQAQKAQDKQDAQSKS